MKEEERFMQEALRLAERGRGLVEPNPMVGAVIVRRGKLIGKGYHSKFGENHAEIEALADCVDHGKSTMYVTLEPCCHHGKTPPCTQAIISAGIRRVVVAYEDPSPNVKGEGVRALRKAGIKVEVGLLKKEAQALNAPYIKLVTAGVPYVTAKWAMSLDGKIATRTGESTWISSEESQHLAHKLRSGMDGIIVGINTVVRDNPLLTVRHARPKRTPVRIVLDTMARTPLASSLVQTARDVDTLIVASTKAPEERREALEEAGCGVLRVNTRMEKYIDLRNLLEFLGKKHFTNLLIEGGGEVLASAFGARLVDRLVAFVAPKVIGGRDAAGPVGGVGVSGLRDAVKLHEMKMRRIGGDLMIDALVRYPG